MNDLQLEMNFNGDSGTNRLRQQLDQGEFVLLMECRSPGKDLDPAAAGERLAELEKQVFEIRSLPTALAVLDGGNSGEFWRAAEFAGALTPENRDRHLFYISGRNADAGILREISGLALRSGVRNLIAVSGDAAKGEDLKATRQRTFLESTEMLRMLGKSGEEMPSLLLGAAVNPFQYSAPSVFAQYTKLMKKLSAGSQLIVTQAGWDMLKLQALRWYLCGRNCFVPTIARLILLTPERVEKILAGQEPGVNISKDFRKILDQELRFSRTQF
ncbi:MAG: methylenetetrahydrofolate reductase, partial [Lentisphaeria bacterium]|nr:methylenetetrahydrofolate reductase [Lentisphaeria bacterium]